MKTADKKEKFHFLALSETSMRMRKTPSSSDANKLDADRQGHTLRKPKKDEKAMSYELRSSNPNYQCIYYGKFGASRIDKKRFSRH